MDRDAVGEHARKVRLAGYAANRFRWRVPAADLSEPERAEAVGRWPSAEYAVRWQLDGLADTRLAQEIAWKAGMHAECFVMAEAMPRVFAFRPMSAQARRCFILGLDAARARHEHDWEAVLSTRLGVVEAAEGDLAEAASWYQVAHALHRGTGHLLGLATVAECWAHVEIERGDYARAEELAIQARDLFAELEPRGVAIAERRLALLEVHHGRPGDAVQLFEDLIGRFEAWGDEVMAARTRAEYAQALIAAHRGHDALEQVTAAGQAFASYGADRDVIRMVELRAAAHAELNNPEQARSTLLAAYRGYAQLGDWSHADRLAEQLAR